MKKLIPVEVTVQLPPIEGDFQLRVTLVLSRHDGNTADIPVLIKSQDGQLNAELEMEGAE